MSKIIESDVKRIVIDIILCYNVGQRGARDWERVRMLDIKLQ